MPDLVDEGIKSVIVPISDLNSILQDGNILLRYRVISKDKNKKSHWSKIYNVDPGITFSELNGFNKPVLSAPTVSPGFVNVSLLSTDSFLGSHIVKEQIVSDSFTFSRDALAVDSNVKNFDVYLSWASYSKSGSGVGTGPNGHIGEDMYTWTDYAYAGTTSSNKFSFTRPDSTYQIPLQTGSYSSPNTTFTTSQNHGILPKMLIYITGISSSMDGYWETEAGTSGNTIVIKTSSNIWTTNQSGTVTLLYQKVSAILTECAFPKHTDILNANNIVLSISDEKKLNNSRLEEYSAFSVWNIPSVKSVQKRNRLNPTVTPTKTGAYLRIETVQPHQYIKGDSITISGTTANGTPGYYDGTYTVTNVGNQWFEFETALGAYAITETIRSATGTISGASQDATTGRWTATISNLAGLNSVTTLGLIIRATSGTGSLGSGTIMVTDVLTGTSIKVQSTSTITNGTISNIIGANATNDKLALLYNLPAPINEFITDNRKLQICIDSLCVDSNGNGIQNQVVDVIDTDYYGYQVTLRSPTTIVDQAPGENARR